MSGDRPEPADLPVDRTPRSTADLPATPLRDRVVPVSAWREAPSSLRHLGDDLPGRPEAGYKRRIGPWLLWRAGPASRGDARWWAAPVDDLDHPVTLRLFPDGHAEGVGPDGAPHARLRTWKEALRDHGSAPGAAPGTSSAASTSTDERPATSPT